MCPFFPKPALPSIQRWDNHTRHGLGFIGLECITINSRMQQQLNQVRFPETRYLCIRSTIDYRADPTPLPMRNIKSPPPPLPSPLRALPLPRFKPKWLAPMVHEPIHTCYRTSSCSELCFTFIATLTKTTFCDTFQKVHELHSPTNDLTSFTSIQNKILPSL
jgi:hypothetical protein